jgi:hypothetical protein
MTDKELERLISFIVNENVILRLLKTSYQSDKLNEPLRTKTKGGTQNVNRIRFLN